MSAFIRNFEIIPTIGSYIVSVDLGKSSVPLSGIVNFVSFPGLTSFKMINAAFEGFENIRSCSALNVFDLSESQLTLNTVVSCLSSFSDRKAITPELTGNIYLSGNNMPILLRYPETGTQEYEFARLYNFLTSQPNPWNVIVNKQPQYLLPAQNQTLNITTTGTDASYVIVSGTVSAFNIRVNNFDGIYVNTYQSISALSGNFVTLTGTPQITASGNLMYAGQNVILSAIDGSLHTFYYFNTGSLLLGVGSKSLELKPINQMPLTLTSTPVVYTPPSRYGYIDGVTRKSFSVNTLNRQTTYVILNTSVNLFSLNINGVSTLSGNNRLTAVSNGSLSASTITLSGKLNLQPSATLIRYLSTVRLTGTNSMIYNLKYFYTSNKITLGIAQVGIEILDPSNYYNNELFNSVSVSAEPVIPPTQLPPEAQ